MITKAVINIKEVDEISILMHRRIFFHPTSTLLLLIRVVFHLGVPEALCFQLLDAILDE